MAAAAPIQRKELKTAAWRAMLTITPAAGRVRDQQKWRDLTDELADRLRQRYDLDW